MSKVVIKECEYYNLSAVIEKLNSGMALIIAGLMTKFYRGKYK